MHSWEQVSNRDRPNRLLVPHHYRWQERARLVRQEPVPVLEQVPVPLELGLVPQGQAPELLEQELERILLEREQLVLVEPQVQRQREEWLHSLRLDRSTEPMPLTLAAV